MKTLALTRSEIVEELGWHTDQPKRAYLLMTPEERAKVIKLGYLPKDIWLALEPRLASDQEGLV